MTCQTEGTHSLGAAEAVRGRFGESFWRMSLRWEDCDPRRSVEDLLTASSVRTEERMRVREVVKR